MNPSVKKEEHITFHDLYCSNHKKKNMREKQVSRDDGEKFSREKSSRESREEGRRRTRERAERGGR
jgi:hypothetical protein